MIVECQNCRTRFNVDPDRIKEGGSKVKCSNCANIFKIFRPAPEPIPEPPALPEEPLFEAGPDPAALAEETPAPSPAPSTVQDKDPFDFGREPSDDDLDFGGLGDDLDLGEPKIGAAPPVPGAGGDDLDLGGLGDDLDFGGLGDDLDMGEPRVEDGPGVAAAGEPVDEDDDLDFGGFDDDLDMGEPQMDDGPGVAAAGEPMAGDDDLDFGGLDDDLGLGEPQGAAKKAPGGADDLDDLDFDGLDDAFELDEETEDGVAADTDEPSFDEGDDVFSDLDMGGEPVSEEDDDHGYNFGDATLLGDEAADEEPGVEDDDVPYQSGYDENGPADFAAEFARPQKKKGRGCLWVLIVILLALAGLAAVFFFAPQVLEPVLKPLGLITETPQSSDDPQGNKFISPENAKHFFRQNDTEGQLLVITGLAKNHYPEPRSFIRLKGLLHDAKGQVLAERQAYCGNLLTEEELSTMSMEDIQKRLNARGGQEGENVNVQSGQSVRFMIVFNQIPIDLAEYTVEAFTSEPVDSK
jgi:predicted Zn finger-like uncharacterized protein